MKAIERSFGKRKMKGEIGKALIVEGELSLQNTLRATLKKGGYGVVQIAPNRAKAIEAIEDQAFDLIIVDLSLSPEDTNDRQGFEVLDAIKKVHSYATVICVTERALSEEITEVLGQKKAFVSMFKREFDTKEFTKLARESIERARHREKTDELVHNKRNSIMLHLKIFLQILKCSFSSTDRVIRISRETGRIIEEEQGGSASDRSH